MARRRFLVELYQLPAEIIIFGSHRWLQRVDPRFFYASQSRLLITRPEPPSVMNLLEFLSSLLIAGCCITFPKIMICLIR